MVPIFTALLRRSRIYRLLNYENMEVLIGLSVPYTSYKAVPSGSVVKSSLKS